MGRDCGVHLYGLRSAIRGNRWLLIVPLFITLVVTLAQVFWKNGVSEMLQVTTAEIMGSLLAGFFGANLLDAEFRQKAGEVVFTKPYPAWRLLSGRVILALMASLALVAANDVALRLTWHLNYFGIALAAAIAPSLFLCALGCILYVESGNVIVAYIGPTLFWVWSTLGEPIGLRFDRLYNPILQISAWSGYLAEPSATTFETLIGNELTLILTAFILIGWCCRRVRTAALQ
ncbi:MAG TPA: hypothetical protein VFJ58_15125 [Armatimonadota bacterium]|nr:hypothetical protein [Armatimonadota bacterium]